MPTFHRVAQCTNPFHLWADRRSQPRGARRLALLHLAAVGMGELDNMVTGSQNSALSEDITSFYDFCADKDISTRFVHIRMHAAAYIEDTLEILVREASL